MSLSAVTAFFPSAPVDEFFASPLTQITILLAVLAVLVAAGVYIVGRFRGGSEKDQPTASELMTNFRELHSQGDLSEQEYRNIKTLLAERLQNELRDTGDKA